MPKSTSSSNSIINLIFRAEAWPDLAENDASAPATQLYLRLHTAALAPGDAGNTAEATFTSYAAVAVARSAAGWVAASGGETSNVGLLQFPECTGGTNIITHVSINTAATGTNPALYTGALAASRTISAGIQAQFSPGALTVLES